MKKITSLMFAFLMLLSCTKEYSEMETSSIEESINPELSAEYFNSVLASNSIRNATTSNVKTITDKDSNRISNQFQSITLKEKPKFDKSISVDLKMENKDVRLHIVPISDFSAYVIIENQYGLFEEAILMDTELLDESSVQVSWITEENVLTLKGDDCKEGATKVQEVGGVIAFGGLLGCAPCPFVGGAIFVVATVMKWGCPDKAKN